MHDSTRESRYRASACQRCGPPPPLALHHHEGGQRWCAGIYNRASRRLREICEKRHTGSVRRQVTHPCHYPLLQLFNFANAHCRPAPTLLFNTNHPRSSPRSLPSLFDLVSRHYLHPHRQHAGSPTGFRPGCLRTSHLRSSCISQQFPQESRCRQRLSRIRSFQCSQVGLGPHGRSHPRWRCLQRFRHRSQGPETGCRTPIQ